MSRPEGRRRAERNTQGTRVNEAESKTSSVLDPEVEGPINAAVHFDERQEKDLELPEQARDGLRPETGQAL